MRRIFKIIGSAFGGAQDIGVGACIAVFLAAHFKMEPSWIMLICGSFLAVLPDMDIAFLSATGRTIHFHHHETLLHRPLIMVPAATVVAFLIGSLFGVGVYAGALACLCVLYHFIHDTPAGIAWGWPFSKKYLGSLRGESVRQAPTPEVDQLQFLRSLLTPTWFSVQQLTVAGIAMAIALSSVTGPVVGVALSLCGALFVFCTWIAYHYLEKREKQNVLG